MQKRITNEKTNDEKMQEIILKGLDEQIDVLIKQKESLQRNIIDFDMEIDNLNFKRKKIIKEGWEKGVENEM